MNRPLPQNSDSTAYRLWRSDEGAARAFVAEVVAGEVFEKFVNHPPVERTKKGEVPTGLPLAVLPPAIAGALNPILLFKASIAQKQLASRRGNKGFGAKDYVQVQHVLDNVVAREEKADANNRTLYDGIGSNGKGYRVIIEQEVGRWVLVSFHRKK